MLLKNYSVLSAWSTVIIRVNFTSYLWDRCKTTRHSSTNSCTNTNTRYGVVMFFFFITLASSLAILTKQLFDLWNNWENIPWTSAAKRYLVEQQSPFHGDNPVWHINNGFVNAWLHPGKWGRIVLQPSKNKISDYHFEIKLLITYLRI